MKFIFPCLFTLLLLASCAESTDHPRPKYDDAENDREFYNFSGAVKSMKRYRNISPKQGHVYESLPQWFMEFTEDGKLLTYTIFQDNGKVSSTEEYEYNAENLLKKITNKQPLYNEKSERFYSYDTINNITTITYHVDSLVNIFKVYYNEKEQVTKMVKENNNGSSEETFRYEKDDGGNLTKELKFQDGELVSSQFYEYNAQGKAIKYITEFNSMKRVWERTWENGYLIQQEDYTLSPDGAKHLDEKNTYDKHYNVIHKKVFRNDELSRELKYSYSYDTHGNWVKRKVTIMEVDFGKTNFIPAFEETQELEYWDE